MSTIAFLGTGTMGMPMARNLAKAGFAVCAWNRSRERAETLSEHGVKVCERPADAARGATVMITMLANAEAVTQVAAQALKSLDAGSIWIQMSTIGIAGTEACAELARDAGVEFVDAPVIGTREPAETGKLVVLASGQREAVDSCGQIFAALGGKTIRFGEAGAGTRAKLVTNSWILGLTSALADSINLARALEIDPGAFLDAIEGTPTDSPYAHLKGPMMISGDYEDAAFRLELARKDAGLALEAGHGQGVELPGLEAVFARLDNAVEAGHGDEDMAAMAVTTDRKG